LCGDKCNREACLEICKLVLSCGHPCSGLCNEPCPLCAVCNKDELTEIFFGNEDEEGARFVLLEDCGHCFEVRGLDKWMNLESDTKKVDAKGVLVRRCPLCHTVVGKSRRYGGILKECMKDVIKIKKKIFGEDRESGGKLIQLSQRLESVQRSGGAETELSFFSFFLCTNMFKNPKDLYTNEPSGNNRNRSKNKKSALKQV